MNRPRIIELVLVVLLTRNLSVIESKASTRFSITELYSLATVCLCVGP